MPAHAAVMAGNLAVYHGVMADQASENREFANHLAEERVRDPRTPLGMLAGGPYKKGVARAQLTEWLDETGTALPVHSGLSFGQDLRRHNRDRDSAEQTLAAGLEMVRESFRDLDPRKLQKFDAHFAGEDVPPIFHHWKQRAEAAAQKSLTWAEWIGHRAEGQHDPRGGATDPQLLNVLQWSADKFQRQNSDPAFREKIAQYTERFTASLEQLTKSNALPPFFLERLRERGVGEILKGDAFDAMLLRAKGYFTPQEDRQFIVLGDTSFETFSHELFHRLGGFGETVVDEAATENKALELRRADAALRGENARWLASGNYVDERTTLGMLQNMVDMSLSELASFEAGEDRAENSRRLRAEFAKRAGLDVIGLVELAYDNPARFASPDGRPLDGSRCAFMCAREIWEQVRAIRSQSEPPAAEPGFEAVAVIVQEARAAILAAGAGALR